MLAARYHLDLIADPWEAAVNLLVERRAVERLWEHDYTLFGPDPTEISNRLGWLQVMDFTRERWPDLVAAAQQIAAENDHVVLAGMGGSSLFPEVLVETFGAVEGFPQLHVIDTTDPAAVVRVGELCPADRTFVVAASKSGSTVETRSHLEYFWARNPDPAKFGVITDPGSALEELATDRGFAHHWVNDPDIGGRYSALSLFGMVPAALLGLDGEALLDAADEMAEALAPLGDEDSLHLGVALGAAIGAAAQLGRDKLTIMLDPRLSSFGQWLEQLIAESLGKHGVGVVPIIDESPEVPIAHPDDRLVVVVGDAPGGAAVIRSGVPSISIVLEETSDLGAHVLLWEVAVAFAGVVLGINPFDQPDVEAAKVAARRLLAAEAPAEPPATPVEVALGSVRPGDYVAICAFVDPMSADAFRLGAVREAIGARLGVATTFGIGPRFLHSTGQLHKGGPKDIVVLQVVGDDGFDAQIPGQSFTFGTLLRAQAAGDLEALLASGQARSYRVSLPELIDWAN